MSVMDADEYSNLAFAIAVFGILAIGMSVAIAVIYAVFWVLVEFGLLILLSSTAAFGIFLIFVGYQIDSRYGTWNG